MVLIIGSMWGKVVSHMTQHNEDKSRGGNATRRTLLKAGLAASAAAVGISTSGVGLAQSEMDLSLSVDAEAELVTITNNGDSEVDLTGYQMNFEAGEDSNEDQIETFAGEVIIGAGESVTVATGAGEEGDVSLEDPYERPEINNENPDVIALLSPEGDVVVTSDGSSGSGSGSDEGDDTEETEDEEEDEESGENGSDEGDEEGDSSEDDEPADNAGDEETTDEDASSQEETTDADDDGVPASEDSDDDCAKVD